MGRGKRYKHVEEILKGHTKPDYSVLEIGCGGAVYRNLFKRYVGTDLPLNPYKRSNDVTVYCDGQELPFKKESFDLIFMVACLYQIPNIEAVIGESKRVLRLKGKILIFDYNHKTTKRLKELEKNGKNENQVWSPFQLLAIVEKNGFNTKIIYDYITSEPTSKGKRSLWRLKVIRYLYFMTINIFRREGWNIVLGEKR